MRVFVGYLARGTEAGRRCRAGPVVAAVGPATAAGARRSTAWPVIWCPTSTSPRACSTRSRSRTRPVAGARVLIPCARDARDVLPETLRARGARGRRAARLRHRRGRRARGAAGAHRGRRLHHLHVRQHREAARGAARGGAADGAGRPLAERLAGVRLCSIGPVTSAALRDLGLPVAVEAWEYTAAGLVAAIAEDARRAEPRSPSTASCARHLHDGDVRARALADAASSSPSPPAGCSRAPYRRSLSGAWPFGVVEPSTAVVARAPDLTTAAPELTPRRLGAPASASSFDTVAHGPFAGSVAEDSTTARRRSSPIRVPAHANVAPRRLRRRFAAWTGRSASSATTATPTTSPACAAP